MISLLAQSGFGQFLMAVLLALASVFMILLILVQQGRGGGLTGALGGMGGQSAFGTKAGDLFTRITIITAVVWITLSILTIAIFNPPPPPASDIPSDLVGIGDDAQTPAEQPDENAPPLNPPKTDGGAAEEATKLNPPEDAVPKEPAATDPNKQDASKQDAPTENPPPNNEEPPKSDDPVKSAEPVPPASGEVPKSDGGKN